MSQDLSGELQGEPEGFQPSETKDDAEARKDFWSIQGDFIYRHHVEPRVQLFVPKEETYPTPLKYVDVTRDTHTNLDALQEKRIKDNWNVDAWTGLTKFTLLNEKPSQGYMWSGERLTKIRATTRLDCWLPEIWSRVSKPIRRKRKRSGCALKDGDKKVRKEGYGGNCSERAHQLSEENQVCLYCGSSRVHKEAVGIYSSNQRFNSINHYNLVHKFIPLLQATKSQMQRQQWTRNGRSSKRFPPGLTTKSRAKKGSHSVSTKREKESPLCYIDGHLSSQQRGVGIKAPKIQRTSGAPR